MKAIQQIETIGYFSRICFALSMSISHKCLIKLTLSGYPSNTCSWYSSYWFHFSPGLRLDAQIVTSCLEHPFLGAACDHPFCCRNYMESQILSLMTTCSVENETTIYQDAGGNALDPICILCKWDDEKWCSCRSLYFTSPNWLLPLSPSLYLTFHLMRDHHHHQ